MIRIVRNTSLLLAFRFFLCFCCFFFLFSFWFGFTLWTWFFLLFLLWGVLVLITIFVIFVFLSKLLVSLVFDSQIVFKTVRKDLINNNSSNLVAVLDILSLFHLFFTGFKGIRVDISKIMRFKEIKEGFSFDLSGDNSLLPSFFIFLFLLYLLNC